MCCCGVAVVLLCFAEVLLCVAVVLLCVAIVVLFVAEMLCVVRVLCVCCLKFGIVIIVRLLHVKMLHFSKS